MKISLGWIEEILGAKLTCSAEELCEKLLYLGFEVSSITNYPSCHGIVVAEILEISKHPNADRLQIAKVTDGTETEKLVCGAPNIAVGQKVFWAKPGAKIANGQTVSKSAIRGFASPGMLCSQLELNAGDDHTGIWNLPNELKCGDSIEELLHLKDIVLDIEITPNRQDCLSHIGIAREISAALNLKPPEVFLKKLIAPELPMFPVAIDDSEACARYIARKLEGVKIRQSPLPIQLKLNRCGIRPINNVVDISNLILIEIGQPLHAFDADKLEGEKIIVRRARKEEKILALDGKTYFLDPEILVIADARKPVAIAGVMGGEVTSVTPSSKNILLESAIFNGSSVRLSRKKLNLASASSYRFERGVTNFSCSLGSSHAEKMMTEITNSSQCAFSDTGSAESKSYPIPVRFSTVEKVLGEKASQPEIKLFFEKLGIPIASQDAEKIFALSPTWRTDLNLEIDMIEEIARLRGYDKIPQRQLFARLTEPAQENETFRFRKKLRFILNSLSFTEVINYGLISGKWAELFHNKDFSIELENPLSEEQSVLRPSLLPELFQNLKTNLSYQKKELRFFEMGAVFSKDGNTTAQRNFLAGIACGNSTRTNWKQKESLPIDFFWMKGAVVKILADLKIPDFKILSTETPHNSAADNADYLTHTYPDQIFHPFYSFNVFLSDEKKIGCFGEAHPTLMNKFGIKAEACIFELDLELLERHSAKRQIKFQNIFRTPVIQRDCSIWVDKNLSWNALQSEMQKTAGAVLTRIDLFDIYSDQKQGESKSLSFTLTFQYPEETLSNELANEVRDKILDHLHKKFSVKLREKI